MAGEQDNAGGVGPGGASISDIMAFDPFPAREDGSVGPAKETSSAPADETAGDKGAQTPKEPPAKEPAKTGPQTPKAPAKEAAPATPPAKPATPQPDVDALGRTVQGLRTVIEQFAEKVPKASAAPADQEQPKYNFQIPDAAVDALTNENPAIRKQAVSGLINGLANALYRDFAQEIAKSQSSLNIPQMIQQHLETERTQQAVAQDMFGAHPGLIPVAQLVQQEAMQYAAELRAMGHAPGWNAEFRDAVAERVYSKVPQLRQAAQQQPTPRPKGKQPFVVNGGGARPAEVTQPESNFMDFIGMK